MLALAVASAVFSSGEDAAGGFVELCLRQFEAFGREALDAAGDAAQRLVAAGAHLVQNGATRRSISASSRVTRAVSAGHASRGGLS